MTFAELQALISRPRVQLGFAIAPLIPGALWALPALAAGGPSVFFMIVLVSGFYGYLILALVGVPAFILANALRWKGLLAYAAIGTFLPGAVVMLLLYRMPQGGPVPLPAIPFLFGTLPTVAFWLIARPDRPDRLVLNLRVVTGFAVAPWIPGFVVGLTYLARIDFTSERKDRYNAAAFMDSISASGLAGYPLAILLGIPLYFLLGRLHGTGIVLYAVLGAVLAAAGWMIPPLAGFLSGRTDGLILPELHGGLLEQPPVVGIVTAVVFWLIVRPDRIGSLPGAPAPASSEREGDERQGNERRGNDRPAGETQSGTVMRRAARTGLAFILVPLLPVALLRPLVADDFPTAFSDLSMRHVGSPGAMLTYSIALLALPGHRFLLARGWTGFLAYAALGPAAVAVAFLIRFLADILVVRSGLVFLPLAYTLKGLPEALAYGLFASVPFWLIARPDRPDKPQASRPGALPNAALSLTRTTTEGPPPGGPER